MNDFKVTKDRRIFIDGTEIKHCLGFSVAAVACKDPEVLLRVSVGSIDIDGYTAAWTKQKEGCSWERQYPG